MAKGKFNMGPMGGMGNMSNMIKQAQKMQQDMLKMQEEIEQQSVEATSGGGAVEDLILVAVNDALKKVDDINQSKMSQLTGGMNIPGLF